MINNFPSLFFLDETGRLEGCSRAWLPSSSWGEMYIYPWSMSFFWKIKPWLIILISPFFLWQGEWTWSNGKGMFSDLPCETLVGFCGGGGGSPKSVKIFIWLWSLVHTRPSSICQNYQLSVPTGLQHPAASAPCKKNLTPSISLEASSLHISGWWFILQPQLSDGSKRATEFTLPSFFLL